MKRILSLLLVLQALFGFELAAQIVTTSPALLQEDSKDVVLTFHADSPLGNKGLSGLDKSTPIYAHIGVITNKSTGVSDWKYTVTPWPDAGGGNLSQANTSKNTLTYVTANTWTLRIGDMRSYFGITDANETIRKIAMVFRTANGNKEGKTASGGDILVDVVDPGFQMSLSHDATGLVISKTTAINFSVNTTRNAEIEIKVNGVSIGTATSVMSMTKGYVFSNTGSYEVVATATSGGETLTRKLDVAYPGASVEGVYPGGIPQMGAVANADGSVTFCLAAPGKSSVVLVPSWDDYAVLDKNVMKYQDYNGNRYFWTTVQGLQEEVYHTYYYIVDAMYKVADPYAHLILDNYSDKWLDTTIWPDMPRYPYDRFDDVTLAVYKKDMDSYSWSGFEIPDHDDLIIYELLFRDFTGTEGASDANGTVRRAIERIPYLKDLGVNAVELLPIMEFNGNNSWGYNTNFYMAPDKAYGSPEDYKDFIDACHRNGMAVILDIVFNQSDGLHPWYQMYPAGANPFYNKVAPHAYSVLNDWNQDNALVQQQWTDAIKYWMTAYNVDGFRFDLVKGLGSNSSYVSSSSTDTEKYNQSRIDNMKRLHSVIKSVKPDGIHINENLASAEEENKMAADGQINWANISYGSQQYTMGHAVGSGQVTRFLSESDDSRLWGSTVSYAESHDEERMGYKQIAYGYNNVIKTDIGVRMKRLGSLAAQMLATPGPKMIWQFGELGADETTKNPDNSNNTDPKKVVWSYLDDADRKALMENYQALCWMRRNNPELFGSDASFSVVGFADNLTANRLMRISDGNKEVMVFINPNVGGANKTIGGTSTLLNANNCRLVTSSPGFTPKLTGTGTSVSVSVPPHSFAVFATNNVVGNEDTEIDIADHGVTVYGGTGEIVVNGDYERVSVYDVAGQAYGSLKVPAGLYIVNVDGAVTKVMVR